MILQSTKNLVRVIFLHMQKYLMYITRRMLGQRVYDFCSFDRCCQIAFLGLMSIYILNNNVLEFPSLNN